MNSVRIQYCVLVCFSSRIYYAGDGCMISDTAALDPFCTYVIIRTCFDVWYRDWSGDIVGAFFGTIGIIL